jgi:hypothetical protein
MRDLRHPTFHLKPGDLRQKGDVFGQKTPKIAPKRAENSLFCVQESAS